MGPNLLRLSACDAVMQDDQEIRVDGCRHRELHLHRDLQCVRIGDVLQRHGERHCQRIIKLGGQDVLFLRLIHHQTNGLTGIFSHVQVCTHHADLALLDPAVRLGRHFHLRQAACCGLLQLCEPVHHGTVGQHGILQLSGINVPNSRNRCRFFFLGGILRNRDRIQLLLDILNLRGNVIARAHLRPVAVAGSSNIRAERPHPEIIQTCAISLDHTVPQLVTNGLLGIKIRNRRS